MKLAIPSAVFVAFNPAASGHALDQSITIGNHMLVPEMRFSGKAWETVQESLSGNAARV